MCSITRLLAVFQLSTPGRRHRRHRRHRRRQHHPSTSWSMASKFNRNGTRNNCLCIMGMLATATKRLLAEK